VRRTTTSELRRGKPSREEFLARERRPISLVLTGLKLANLGSVLRTADAALVEHVYICETRFKQDSLRFRKVSKGSERWVPHSCEPDLIACVEHLRSRGCMLVALEQAHGAVCYHQASWRFPMALVVGSEHEGVREDALARMDSAVEIPLSGMGNSLNVAVATGIVLFEIIRKMEGG
jgi:tRNA G18 (ribose-2'-O)-methylase SpoU